MLIPYSTDAPIYHYSVTTAGLIVANTGVFILEWMAFTAEKPELIIPWTLVFGEWNPVQWLTSAFLHADIWHLIGNMLFLFVFGLILEGKIGWMKFLFLYLGLAMAQAGIVQTLMLGAEEGFALGASGAIFGVMAVAMIWAPVNEITCLLILGFRIVNFEVQIWALAFLYIALDFFFAVIGRFEMSTEVLHLTGAILGLPLGALMVTRGWVDCENWDVFSIRKGRHAMSREQLAEQKANTPEAQEKCKQKREEALKQIHALIAEGNPALAYAAHIHCRQALEGWSLSDQDLLRIIAAFHGKQQWRESIPAMAEYVRRPNAPQQAVVRLWLARVLIEHEKRPGQALRILAKINENGLNESQQKALRHVRQKAAKLHEEDPYEVAEHDW